jgi:uncharacterized delta-60 repeat protein
MKTSLRKTSHTPGTLQTLSEIPRRFKTRLVKARRRQVLALLIGILLLNSNLLVRVRAADGDLDLSFDGDGKVVTGFVDSFFDGACAVAVQADSKIVAAGIAMDPNSGNAVVGLVRYNVDGSLDQNFGAGGLVLTDFHDHSLFDGDIAIQNDGKILFAGTVGDVPDPSDFGVARFDTNGNPDPTFGIGGKVISDFFGGNDAATSMSIQSDGKIVLAGFVSDINSFSDFALARYDTSGNLDQTFGVGGKITTDFFGLEDEANGVAIQSDGKIVVAGTVTITGYITDFGLARYDTNGNLDQSFGNGGKVITDVGGNYDQGNALAIQSDGKIVIAGTAANGSSFDFTLIRYDGSGGLDANFGVGGIAFTDFFGGPDRVLDLAIQGDGKIVAVGTINNDPSDVETFSNFGIARYETNGSPDQTFGTGGKVDTDFFATDFAEGVAIQPDCKIVVAGFSWDFNLGSDFALARYDSGGCLVASTCPLTQGYWKNHAALWPVDSLTLGSQTYTKTELLNILNNSTQTDVSLTLARQLIAAKLNIASGSNAAPVSATITHADGLLSGFAGKLPYKVKSSSAVGQAMTGDSAVFNSYNSGLLTPGCTP